MTPFWLQAYILSFKLQIFFFTPTGCERTTARITAFFNLELSNFARSGTVQILN